jgi:hypothetical protein
MTAMTLAASPMPAMAFAAFKFIHLGNGEIAVKTDDQT